MQKAQAISTFIAESRKKGIVVLGMISFDVENDRLLFSPLEGIDEQEASAILGRFDLAAIFRKSS